MEQLVLSAGIPSAVVGLVAFLGRKQIEGILDSLKELAVNLRVLNDRVGGHAEELARNRADLESFRAQLAIIDARQYQLVADVALIKRAQ